MAPRGTTGGAQVTALGLPTEADEARIFFLRNQVDAVRHGDHFDFIVNGRLIHVVDDAVADCGGDCGGAPGHNRGGFSCGPRRVGFDSTEGGNGTANGVDERPKN